MPALSVVATTPVTGIGFDRDKVPAMVQTLTAEDFYRTLLAERTEALMQRMPGVNTTDVQGNGFFQDLRYRGFVGLAAAGHAAGTRRLYERHPPQRGVRRHRQLGLHPDRSRSTAPTSGPAIRCSASTRWAARSTCR